MYLFIASCSVHLGAAALRTRELKTMKRLNHIVRRFMQKKIRRKSFLSNRQRAVSSRHNWSVPAMMRSQLVTIDCNVYHHVNINTKSVVLI